MSRNSSVNNIIMTWWCDSAAFLFCVFAITMVLSFYPVTSHAEEGEQDYWYYKTNKYGFFTKYPLYIVADTDNNRSNEDIIFGFDSGDYSRVKEKMRLTDEGRLGIGTFSLDAPLDVRSYGTWVGNYNSGQTVARLGAVIHLGSENGSDIVNHFGFKVRVHGRRKSTDDVYLQTRVGFNLTSAEEQRPMQSNLYGYPNLTRSDEIAKYNEHRALTMEMVPNWSGPRVAVAYDWNHQPTETLDVNGAIRIGDTSNENAGTIRYSDGNFQGYDGSQWLPFGLGDNDVVLRSGHQLIFGSTDSHRTPNNFFVNSLNVPDDNIAEFPIPETGNNYNNDDDGTSGGVALITDGLPRLTVKGNGNTYVHKRLSIGVGANVPDTVLTVAGSVHIGPDNLTPTIFDYGDQLADYLLWVEKGIVSEDFAIANVDNWSDHVLQDDYDLKPLSEVEDFIQKEGHLPGVPSARDVKDNGYTVHEMTRTLLGKVEELTLHTIAQQKALEAQQAEIAELRVQLGEGRSDMQAASFHVKTGY